jgi:nanoRNase/pAp phosphatase (c-di-AMP/oligoRNAs hydrolase)
VAAQALGQRVVLDHRRRDDASRLATLVGAFVRADRAVILTHDNPDPDAIASAAGVRFLIEEACGIPAVVTFGGIVGRAENRALMDAVGVPFERIEGFEFFPGDAFVLVDAQPGSGNNAVPVDARLAAVIDHHPQRDDPGRAVYHDVRENYGACSTMVVELLRAGNIEPDRALATALFYAIQSETLDLGREAASADIEASIYLYPRTAPAALSRIRHARVPRGLFQSLHDGLERAWHRDGVVCVPVGRLAYPDLVAQLADFFLRVQDVEWVVAVGRHRDDLLVSVRGDRPGAHAGVLVRKLVDGRGSAGGHGQMAGARIPVPGMSDADADAFVDDLFLRFCDLVGVADAARRPLLDVDLPEASDA